MSGERAADGAGAAGAAEIPDTPEAVRAELRRLRAELARTDHDLVLLLTRRVELARSLQPLKRALGHPVLDPSREATVVRKACEEARAAGLPEEEVRAIIWRVIGLCRRTQEPG